MLEIIPNIKIEPNGITITNKYYFDTDKHTNLYDRFENLREKQSSCYSNFSIGSRKRLKRAFILLHAISNKQTVYDPIIEKNITFTLNMITLTLSAKQGYTTDKEIKNKLLNDFLTRLRQNKGLTHYIWRAEPQKNNNIHFHIITNKYFNYQYIRDTWNNVQKKLGYINLFNEKYHHINPNSTDIHSIKNIHNASRYVGKYIQKMLDSYRDIDGKYWDCSNNLKPKYNCVFDGIYEDRDILEYIYKKLDDRIIYNEHYTFIPLNHNELLYYLPERWNSGYKEYLEKIKNS